MNKLINYINIRSNAMEHIRLILRLLLLFQLKTAIEIYTLIYIYVKILRTLSNVNASQFCYKYREPLSFLPA